MTFSKKSRAVLMLSPLFIVSSAFASTPEGLNPPSGFIDPQFRYTQGAGSSVNVVDSAVYLSKSFGNAYGMVDLPVLTDNPNKVQAVVSYKFANGLSWKIGKFDGIFGLERNDTGFLPFFSQGVTYSLQPVTHTALMLGYGLGEGMDLNIYADVSGASPQYGGKFSYNNGFRFAVGGYTDEATSMFLNASAGLNAGDMTIDAEYTMKTPAGDGAVSESGIGAHLGYTVNDSTKVYGRFTMLSNGGNVDGASTMEITAGPAFAVTKDLTVKVNGNYNMVKDGANTAALAVTSTILF